MKTRDIRKAKWHEEISEYFGIEARLLRNAVRERKDREGIEPEAMVDMRESIARRFMSPEGEALYRKVRTGQPQDITDLERSASWKEYVFVCLNGERTCFQRLPFYDRIIECIVEPLLAVKEPVLVLDYGCGSSLLTRLLAQDFRGRVSTISADVCKHAVNFAVARNRLYNSNASGILIENVMAVLETTGIDLILAYAVFEHLPNSSAQIKGLVDALAPGGVLVENYAGHSTEMPHKSDTFSAYRLRDQNLDMLSDSLSLLEGELPAKHDGVYEKNSGTRVWVKGDMTAEPVMEIRKRLEKTQGFWERMRRSARYKLSSDWFKEST